MRGGGGSAVRVPGVRRAPVPAPSPGWLKRVHAMLRERSFDLRRPVGPALTSSRPVDRSDPARRWALP